MYLDYKDRLEHELSIIIEMKYSSYFLIVSDYIKWAKNNDIQLVLEEVLELDL
jgi:DNA polymerase-3 subunit alpha